MTIINNNNPEVSMIANISAVLSNTGVASTAVITSVGGQLMALILFIIFTFLIEQQIVAESYISSKIIFAIMSGVELWSIAANALIIVPNFPFLRLFKKYLSSEIGKKLSLTQQEVEDLLEETKRDKNQV